MEKMISKHLSKGILLVLSSPLGCRQPSAAPAPPTVQSPQQLLDLVLPPGEQTTPALLESDQANVLFAHQELAFAQRNGVVQGDGSASGTLSIAQAEDHIHMADLILKQDQDRAQWQQDVMNARSFSVPRSLRESQ